MEQLAKKFPRSPRVDVLQGIRIEASERPEVALQYYDQLLDADPSNAVGGSLCFAIRSGSHKSLLAGSLEKTNISPSTRRKARGGCERAFAVSGHILHRPGSLARACGYLFILFFVRVLPEFTVSK